MKFEDFIKKGLARRATKDIQLAKSLLKSAEQDLKFFHSIEINKISSRKIISNYYDSLRSLIEAVAAIEGYKIYSHEAFAYYLLERGQENISQKFDRFRKIRNAINYYGKEIMAEEAKEIVKEITPAINKVKDELKKILENE